MSETLKFGNGQWATKEGSALAYNDENGNFKPLPFTFDRSTSATRVNKQGLIEVVPNNEPRIDFKDSSEGALLLEPQRSNLFHSSNNFSNWSKTNGASISSDVIISPDGTLNADKLSVGTTNLSPFILINNSVVGLEVYTQTIYAKSGDGDVLQITGSTGFASHFQNYNLSNGTLGNNNIDGITTKASIEYVGNGWYRCTYTSVCGQTTAGGRIVFAIVSEGSGRLSGANLTINTGLYIYGAQFEQGSYATSYIPTSGSAVTRVIDKCINGGNNSVINSTQGTIYGEQKSLETDFTYNYFLSVSDGTINNRLEIRQAGTSLQFLWRVGGIYQGAKALLNAPFSSTIKYALRYSSTDIKFYVNGSLIDTINSPTLYSSGVLNNIEFADGGGLTNFRGTVKDVKYYNTALTDQELIALTS